MHARRVGVLLVVALLIGGGTMVFGGRSAVAGDPCYNVNGSSRGVSTAGVSGGVINGTPRADTIYVEGDGYTIYAGSGNDVICAYGENNVVYGGPGSDYIYGMTSAYGEAGNDYIDVWNAEVIDGGPGNDYIYFDSVDQVSGGSGGDTIYGEDAWAVYGNSGADYIGIDYVDLLDCGSAYDEYYTSDVNQIVNCEEDVD